jgi:hypothetical protein
MINKYAEKCLIKIILFNILDGLIEKVSFCKMIICGMIRNP